MKLSILVVTAKVLFLRSVGKLEKREFAMFGTIKGYIVGKKVSGKIREGASELNNAKDEIADKVVSVVSYPAGGFILVGSVFTILVRVLTLVSTLFNAFHSDESAQRGLKQLVVNVISDIVARINEIANLSERVSTHQEVLSEVEALHNAVMAFKFEDAYIDIFERSRAYTLRYMSSDLLKMFITSPRVPPQYSPVFAKAYELALKKEAAKKEKDEERKKYKADARYKSKESGGSKATSEDLLASFVSELAFLAGKYDKESLNKDSKRTPAEA